MWIVPRYLRYFFRALCLVSIRVSALHTLPNDHMCDNTCYIGVWYDLSRRVPGGLEELD